MVFDAVTAVAPAAGFAGAVAPVGAAFAGAGPVAVVVVLLLVAGAGFGVTDAGFGAGFAADVAGAFFDAGVTGFVTIGDFADTGTAAPTELGTGFVVADAVAGADAGFAGLDVFAGAGAGFAASAGVFVVTAVGGD